MKPPDFRLLHTGLGAAQRTLFPRDPPLAASGGRRRRHGVQRGSALRGPPADSHTFAPAGYPQHVAPGAPGGGSPALSVNSGWRIPILTRWRPRRRRVPHRLRPVGSRAAPALQVRDAARGCGLGTWARPAPLVGPRLRAALARAGLQGAQRYWTWGTHSIAAAKRRRAHPPVRMKTCAQRTRV